MPQAVRSGIVKPEPGFRWRGSDVTRIESFSDAVFAFSVTLLVVSLEVPHSFAELLAAMRGFPAFGLCFAVLAWFWYSHVVYFRRYGLHTGYVVALNSLLLFCLLFYIYPLKFLFAGLLGPQSLPVPGQGFSVADMAMLFAIYGGGYAATNVIFVLLYHHAWRCRAALELDASERLLTWQAICNHAALVLIALCSVVLAYLLPANVIGLAGVFYFSIPVYFAVAGRVFGQRRRRLVALHAHGS